MVGVHVNPAYSCCIEPEHMTVVTPNWSFRSQLQYCLFSGH